jgi:flagellar motor switch/type III secretory pathway protein FliN
MALRVLNRDELVVMNQTRTWCERVFQNMGNTLFPQTKATVRVYDRREGARRIDTRTPAFAIAHPDGAGMLIWRSLRSTTGHVGLHAQIARELGRMADFHGWSLTDSSLASLNNEPVMILFETDRTALLEIECWANLPVDTEVNKVARIRPAVKAALQARLNASMFSLGTSLTLTGIMLRVGTEHRSVRMQSEGNGILLIDQGREEMDGTEAKLTLDLGELEMTIEELAALRCGGVLRIGRPEGAIATVRLGGVAVAAGTIEINEDATLTFQVTDIFSGRRNFLTPCANHL